MTRGPKFTRATCTTPSRTRARPYTVSRYIYGKERGRSLSHLSSTGRQADNSRCGANATAAIDDVLLRFLELAHPLRPLPSHFHYHLVHSAFHFLLYPIHLANSFFPQFPLSGSITLYFYPEKFIINFILLKNIYIYIVIYCKYY